MKPRIGITGNYKPEERLCTLAEGYYRSVIAAGGIPVIIPPQPLSGELVDLLKTLDGLVLSGGGDIEPSLLGEERHPSVSGVDEERDRMELALVREAYNRQIPMLGICKGGQVINVALGGSIYQDIGRSHSQSGPKWETSHSVLIEEDSLLHRLFGTSQIDVNSFHHQAVKTPAPCLKITAVAPDGVIEALESNEYKSILCVQWHPEGLFESGSRVQEFKSSRGHQSIFDWLVGEAEEFRRAKEAHRHFVSIDTHCDTPMCWEANNPVTLVDAVKMEQGHLDATIMVAYLKQMDRDEASLKAATQKADRLLDLIETKVHPSMGSGTGFILRQAQEPGSRVAYTPADLYRNKLDGVRSVMMGIENGYAIGRDLGNVERFRKRGVVYMTLCHNGDNDICDSAKGAGEHGGVSRFGEKVIMEMNRVGMMVDLSHAHEKSFYDALEISRKPVLCSHSSARALCDHPRNLTDDQMRALARKGGVAQVTFYDGFLRQGGGATIEDAVSHLNHMVRVMGVDHVGVGTDFDGDGGVPGVGNASELINFTRRLLRERYSEKDLELIWGGNFMRLLPQGVGK